VGNDSLLGKGVIDSTGVLELIDYLENEFRISVAEKETTSDSFDNIDKTVQYVG
jgi:acyl carrier protein